MQEEKTRKLYVGTSWKMNKTVNESRQYIHALCDFMNNNPQKIKNLEVFVLPAFLAIDSAIQIINKTNSDLKIGAQDCCWEDFGAFTGEVSPMHLKDLGATYVELGHAERRNIFMETDEMVSKKVAAVIKNNMKPILCIGEEEKPSQINIALHFLEHQLLDDLDKIDVGDLKNIVIAYEPVWAIGATASAPLDYIEEAMDFLRNLLNKKFGSNCGNDQVIIYGGSVTPESARDILALKNNDGIFVGRAALNVEYFINMIKMASEIQKIK
ncbi:MAG: triose-phosphate isomerase [Cyanobacteria bacterium]|nr:triose-phosphate isomerase [Cyanobacteriota bacterium]